MKTLRIGGAVVGAVLFLAAQAQAIIAFSDASGLAGNQTAGPYLFGNIFTVGSSALTVTRLGAFDSGGTGAFGSSGVNVAIYSVNVVGTSITIGAAVANASTTFSGSGFTMESGNYAFRSLSTPATLAAGGTYMVVANNYGVGTGNSLGYNASVPTANHQAIATHTGGGLVSYDSGFYHNNGSVAGLTGTTGWSFQSSGVTGYATYGAGNFDFTPVPEAATFGLAGVAVLGLVYVGRYARMRRILKPA